MVKALNIGELVAPIPVVQGGMGVGISLAGLASAVARAGGVGVISTAQIGFRKPEYDRNPHKANLEAIGEELNKAKEMANGGIVGVNIMVATTGYEEYVKAAVKAGADVVISGAGLPMNLPELVAGSKTKIAPIVSSEKATSIILRQWLKKYNRLPDMVIIEGPLAGGHLGFSRDYFDREEDNFDEEIKAILAYVKGIADKHQVTIPVVVGGGVFERRDMDHYLAMGAAGVQLGTRFVATKECDAHEAYKEAYVKARKEDVVLIKSPVGLPGRALRNAFLERIEAGERIMGPCRNCVKSCKPATAPFCISQALINAAKGKLDEGLIFCGENVHRVKEIVPVASIMGEFA